MSRNYSIFSQFFLGIVRYWPSIAHAGSSYEVNSDLQGTKKCPIFLKFKTFYNLVIFLEIFRTRMLLPMRCATFGFNFDHYYCECGFDLPWRNWWQPSWNCLSDSQTSTRYIDAKRAKIFFPSRGVTFIVPKTAAKV